MPRPKQKVVKAWAVVGKKIDIVWPIIEDAYAIFISYRKAKAYAIKTKLTVSKCTISYKL